MEVIIQARLDHDIDFLKLCILRLHSQQDSDEQAQRSTHRENNRGFNKSDAAVLSGVAESFIKGDNVSMDSYSAISRRMHKYAKQLMHLLSEDEILL